MDLQEIRKRVQIVTAEPDTNIKLKAWIDDPEDCFGRGYLRNAPPLDKYCRQCMALCELDGKYQPINQLCERLTKELYGEMDVEAEAKPRKQGYVSG